MAAIFSVVISLIVLLTAVRVFAMSPPTGCATRELLLLSPCLPYISASPIRYGSFRLLRAVSSAYDSIRRHLPMLLSSRTSDLGLSVEQYEADRSVFVFFSLNGGMYLEKNNSPDSLCAAILVFRFMNSASSSKLEDSRNSRT
ncbi:uncharacterized protein LOC111436771 [Cucurbita moschata]|uniref:Uncharacterized protein LOC111436771 n=1 Tax=Cucurbita moschata TaxID=3662 RepID=A0A6J1EPX6_CUCMO|nr:uncharacterized protein LOC111436771 [Cucurbita moschata]